MATASLIDDTDFLKCPVCSEKVKDPVILPSLDTVCKCCYDNWDENSQDKAAGKREEEKTKCPETSASHQQQRNQTSLQANHFMKVLAEVAECSDPSVAKSCDYCSYGNDSVPAVERCLQCRDNLCRSCAEAHKKTKLTRTHPVITFEQIEKGELNEELRRWQYVSCDKHESEAVRFLCNKCDQLVCRECKVSDHDRHNCTDLAKACERYKATSQTMINKVKQKIPSLENYYDFLDDYHRHVETSKVETVREIEHKASALHKLIDQYRQSLIDKVMPAVLEEQSKIEQRQCKLDEHLRVLKHSSQYVDALFRLGKDDEILSTRRLVTDRLTQLAYSQPETMTTKLSISFRDGNSAATGASQSVFGAAEVLEVPLSQDNVREISNNRDFDLSTAMPMFGDSVRLVREFECRGSSDHKDIWPSGIDTDLSGNMLIVDRDNRRVKVFDAEGTLVREFGHSGAGKLITPYDVTVLYNGNIAVTDYEDECVKIYSHTGDYITKWSKDFKYPRGITTNRVNHQVVVVDSTLNRLTIHDSESGAMQREVKGKTAEKLALFNEPYYVTTTNNGYTVVTDWVTPNIKLFDASGKYLSKYGTYGVSQGRLLQPYGVCSDSFGYIFVADNQNNRVHLLGPDGKFIRFLLHEKHGLWHPMALTINPEGDLVVTEALGKVKVFKYV